MASSSPSWTSSLIAGGMAGTSVDVALFPLDTIKTRIQSSPGFWKSGGFSRIYAGLGPAALGSAPNAALFFVTYDVSKRFLAEKSGSNQFATQIQMFSAALGETTACLIRVPVEIVKQRRQAGEKSSLGVCRATLKAEGWRGFYRGYLTTVLREIPFSIIQFPLWEWLKKTWAQKQERPLLPWQSSLCGALAGGFSAGVTTPLDVAKTRIMLAKPDDILGKTPKTFLALKMVAQNEGVKSLFSGVTPRVMWISIGGSVFFGVYEKVISMLEER